MCCASLYSCPPCFHFQDSGPLYALKSYVILMGKLSAALKAATARLNGFFVDDVGDASQFINEQQDK